MVIGGRLVPNKAEPPKLQEPSDADNPNNGRSTPDLASSSSNSTKMTVIRVLHRIRERKEGVVPQLYERLPWEAADMRCAVLS